MANSVFSTISMIFLCCLLQREGERGLMEATMIVSKRTKTFARQGSLCPVCPFTVRANEEKRKQAWALMGA